MKNCNKCSHINITEEEQHMLKTKTFHYCNKYGARVIHKSNDIGFHAFIYPCKPCCDDEHKYYEEVR